MIGHRKINYQLSIINNKFKGGIQYYGQTQKNSMEQLDITSKMEPNSRDMFTDLFDQYNCLCSREEAYECAGEEGTASL